MLASMDNAHAASTGDVHTEPLFGPHPETTEVRRASLSVIVGPDVGQVFATGPRRCVIGTDPTANVRLNDRAVSRFHCEIVVGPSELSLKDLSSRNGTRIDGVRVDAARLHEGAVITVGSTQLALTMDAQALRVPISSHAEFGGLVGVSVPMRRTFALLEQASRTDVDGAHHRRERAPARNRSAAPAAPSRAPGSGRARHRGRLHRASTPCRAARERALRSREGRLHRGHRRATGAFEQADGGTLFLDEVGELPLDLQPSSCASSSSGEVEARGRETHPTSRRARGGATNRDLRTESTQRRFRSDLYYRLAVWRSRCPR
jgi:two-component system response regulator GlrR